MRYIFLGFLILLIALWLGLWISEDSGYILIRYNHWSLETSLWIGIAILLVSFLVLYCLIRLCARTFSLPERFERWRRMRGYRKARQYTDIGLCQLHEGYWQDAQKTLLRAARLTKYPLINYLAAARAANEMRQYDQRDHYFKQALIAMPDAECALLLAQAQLQINSQQYEPAIATLSQVLQKNPQQHLALALLQQIYVTLADWQSLERMLPELEKNRALSVEKFTSIVEMIHCQRLTAAGKRGPQALNEYWDHLPRQWRNNLVCQRCYARQLIATHQDTLAAEFIEGVLKKNWDGELIKLYGEACSDKPVNQLKNAENWYKKHPHDAMLLLTLGRLAEQERFWGKASEYLKRSVEIKPTAEAYFTLGATLEAVNQLEEALKAYRNGLKLSV